MGGERQCLDHTPFAPAELEGDEEKGMSCSSAPAATGSFPAAGRGRGRPGAAVSQRCLENPCNRLHKTELQNGLHNGSAGSRHSLAHTRPLPLSSLTSPPLPPLQRALRPALCIALRRGVAGHGGERRGAVGRGERHMAFCFEPPSHDMLSIQSGSPVLKAARWGGCGGV